MRRALPLLVVLALVGCGSGGDDSGPGKPVSGSAAIEQAHTLNRKLDDALSSYREGDRGDAASKLSAARDAHWTPIRAAIRQADPEIGARLDAALQRQLPQLIDRGVTVTQLARPLASVEADVDRAAGKLRGT
jgi:hypothetical protein